MADPLSRDDAVAALDFVYGVEQWDERDDDLAQMLVDGGPEAVSHNVSERDEIRRAVELVTGPGLVVPRRARRPSSAATRRAGVERSRRYLQRHAPHLLIALTPETAVPDTAVPAADPGDEVFVQHVVQMLRGGVWLDFSYHRGADQAQDRTGRERAAPDDAFRVVERTVTNRVLPDRPGSAPRPVTGLRALSAALEELTGYDSILTIERVHEDPDVPGVHACPFPHCRFRSGDAARMWTHLHFSRMGHGLTFDGAETPRQAAENACIPYVDTSDVSR